MFFWKKINIADHERAFMYSDNRFVRVLTPGSHRFTDFYGSIRIETFDITRNVFEHVLGKFLVTTFADQTRDHIQGFQLGNSEVGLLYRDGQLVETIAPGGFRLYWKGPEKVEMVKVDISDNFRVSDELLRMLGRNNKELSALHVAKAIYYTEVADNHRGLLLVNSKLEKILEPGSYGFWRFQRNIEVKHLDLRLQNMEVSGQEILTKDRVSLRLNLSAAYCVDDPSLAYNLLSDLNGYLYREFQLQLREAVGTKTLDELLNDKDSLNRVISEGIRQRVAEYGIVLKSVGVRDIILPGDMKTMLNQVVEAEKVAQANMIRRRDEAAATRSLHNTAKIMEGNPMLMRLKELEVLETVTERIGNITVYSGLEGVMTDLIKSPSALKL